LFDQRTATTGSGTRQRQHRQQAAVTPAAGSGNTGNRQRQQVAATPAKGSSNNGGGQRQLWQRAAAADAVLLEFTNSLKF